MSDYKDTHGKHKLTLVPRRIIYDISRIREYGNNKYPDGGPDNWKNVPIEDYRDATFRHLLAYLDDPHGCDEESGMPHLWHLACNISFLCELEQYRTGFYADGKPVFWTIDEEYIGILDQIDKGE